MILLRHLLARRLRNDDPGADGAGAPAADPVQADPSPAPAPESSASPAPADAPADPMAGLRAALDAVDAPSAAAPAGQTADAAPADPNAPAPSPAAPAAPADPAAPKPAPAPGEEEPPEGVSERAKGRWAKLTERAATAEATAREAQETLSAVRSMVADTGMAPQEFETMLGLAKAYKSNNPQDMQRALQQVDALRSDLCLRLGVDTPPADALAAHPDLLQEVNGMLMTRERAMEIARLRQEQAQFQQLQQREREASQFKQTVEQASQSLGSSLQARANEPGHAEKMAAVQRYFADPQRVQKFVQTYQPGQWEAAVQMIYEAAPVSAAAPIATAPVAPQPLRPTSVRTGGPRAAGPMTAAGAVEQAFTNLGL